MRKLFQIDSENEYNVFNIQKVLDNFERLNGKERLAAIEFVNDDDDFFQACVLIHFKHFLKVGL